MMENYKYGDLTRYDLDYEDRSERSIRGLVYCSVTGFGQTGPYAPRPGYDAMFQAMGGMMSVTGHIDDAPGAGPNGRRVDRRHHDGHEFLDRDPRRALSSRVDAGRGQHLDVGLLDS